MTILDQLDISHGIIIYLSAETVIYAKGSTMILVTIVSVSLNDDILEGIDKLQKTLGFTGRSEIVRAGIRKLLAEERMKQDLEGTVNSLLLAVHDEDSDDQVKTFV